jgi:hypothetical protein
MADDFSPAAGAFPTVNERRMGTGQDSEKNLSTSEDSAR